LVSGLLPSEIGRASCRHNTAAAISSDPTHTLVAYRLPFEAIHIFLILNWPICPCVSGRMATAKKLHAEGNLHPAPLFCIREVRGPEAYEMKDST